jgi:adenylate cyclase, class 2
MARSDGRQTPVDVLNDIVDAMTNIEVKARYPDLENARAICRRLEASDQGILNQTDTYFGVPIGRLKLRQINDDRAELIAYNRPNNTAARESNYELEPVTDIAVTLDRLARLHGLLCIVRKRRELYLWHNVRIHLDEVEGLGCFIEFEAVVSESAGEEISRRRVDKLVDEFAIEPQDRIGVSYSDLLLAK